MPALFVFLFCVSPWAQEVTVVYVEGDTSRKDTGGALRRLDFGDALSAGDSVITKKNGRAELELPNRSAISVRPDTVFTIGEAELSGGEKQSVLTTAVGSVAYKLNKFTGSSPLIRSNSMVAGVRGTELEVYAGMDGSSLVVVTEGQVELTAQGTTVSLGVNEAVEVRAGQAPGEKYAWLGKEMDFSSWNDSKMDEFLKDPVAGIERVEKQLAYFRDEMQALLPVYEELTRESTQTAEEFQRLRAGNDAERAKDVQNYLINDLNKRWSVLFLNIRYYALSYLSMRRFVVGGLYAEMRSRYILKQDDPAFQDFFGIYGRIIKDYEEKIVPQLVEADI
ncbi:MAG: FecR family protein [Spirochaetales bacterium]|nr:FecR family protein [Spirochaetales bacterium]